MAKKPAVSLADLGVQTPVQVDAMKPADNQVTEVITSEHTTSKKGIAPIIRTDIR